MRVLLVEDDEAHAALVRRMLREDWALTVAATVDEATDLVRERRFDVAVLDHRLPDGTGLDLLGDLRRIEPGLPVVFLTGMGDEHVAMEALGHGAVEYLVKDVDTLEHLSATLRDVVDEWSGLHQLARPVEGETRQGAAPRRAGAPSHDVPDTLAAYLEQSDSLGLGVFDRAGRLLVSKFPDGLDAKLLATRAAALAHQAGRTGEAAGLYPSAHATFLQNEQGLLVLACGPGGRLLALLLPAGTGPLSAMRRVQEAARILQENNGG